MYNVFAICEHIMRAADCKTLSESPKGDFRQPVGCPNRDSPLFYASVAAMTALMVCIRFSASSKTMERGDSNTSSVTSIQSMPNLS